MGDSGKKNMGPTGDMCGMLMGRQRTGSLAFVACGQAGGRKKKEKKREGEKRRRHVWEIPGHVPLCLALPAYFLSSMPSQHAFLELPSLLRGQEEKREASPLLPALGHALQTLTPLPSISTSSTYYSLPLSLPLPLLPSLLFSQGMAPCTTHQIFLFWCCKGCLLAHV